MSRPVENGWLAFLSDVMPPGASHEQIADARIAFFTGATEVMREVLLAVTGEDLTPVARIRLGKLLDEVHRFAGEMEVAALVTSTPERGSPS